MKKLLARLAVTATLAAGLSVFVAPAPDAAACRPVIGSTTGTSICASIYGPAPAASTPAKPRLSKCARIGKRYASKPRLARAKVARCHRAARAR